MMHVVKKWEVTIESESGASWKFSMNDDHYQNVLRDLAKMDFGRNVIRISITEEKLPKQEGVAIGA